jgi:hypothetical protein
MRPRCVGTKIPSLSGQTFELFVLLRSPFLRRESSEVFFGCPTCYKLAALHSRIPLPFYGKIEQKDYFRRLYA